MKIKEKLLCLFALLVFVVCAGIIVHGLKQLFDMYQLMMLLSRLVNG